MTVLMTGIAPGPLKKAAYRFLGRDFLPHPGNSISSFYAYSSHYHDYLIC